MSDDLLYGVEIAGQIGRLDVTSGAQMPVTAGETPPRDRPGLPAHVRVAVVGAGFAGLGVGAQLRRAGIEDFVVLERAGEVGGTWRDNTYPGCTCDVPSQLYSFSFALNPAWTRSFSAQPEINAYLRRVVDDEGLGPHLRLHHELLAARWEQGSRLWRLHTSQGELTADVVVFGTGALSEPSVPRLPGLDGFEGEVFHSARWNHDLDLTGKRVAVVGTGASAIQFLPRIQPQAGRLHLFQRTPAWVMPRADRAVTAVERAVFHRMPAAQRAARAGVYSLREAAVPAFVRHPRLLRLAERVAKRHLRAQVRDPALRAALTPRYEIGCKRILISNDFYPALSRSNVEVVASGVAALDRDCVVAADGTERKVDAVIFGTGFHVTELPVADRIYGRDGHRLTDTWQAGMQALRGTTVAGFPNLFLIVGPNTGLAHSSMVYMIESQVAYVLDALRQMRSNGLASLEPRPSAQRRWNDDVQRRMGRTVWSSGCASWYLDAGGRNTTLWPGATWRFRRGTRRIDLAEFDVTPAAPATPATPAPPVPTAAHRPGAPAAAGDRTRG